MIQFAIATVSIILFYVLLNLLYKHTNHYKNSLLSTPSFVEEVPSNISFAVFGSTYAQNAFGSIKELGFNRAFSFALPCESAEADFQKLKLFSSKLEQGCVVAITLAPCNTLYSWGQLDEGQKHYGFMPKHLKKDWNIMSFVRYYLPLFPLKIRKIFFIFRNVKKKESIYDTFPDCVYTNVEIKNNSRKMAELWMNLFCLSNLKEPLNSENNIRIVKENTLIISQMEDYCFEHGFIPIIVLPPFIGELNDYFSDIFIDSTLGPIFRQARQKGVNVYDFRKNSKFQNNPDLYSDGFFRLNKYGSVKFLKCLFSHLKEDGIVLNNNRLRV